MLKIDPKIVSGIRACASSAQLRGYLQNAVELEHATIPPYLTAMFSLKPGTNERIESRIRGVVIQEMMHMTIAANVLIAIGGAPRINAPRFVPSYPGGLPMGIGGAGFEVPIAPFSKQLLEDVFMVIEEPEDPIHVDEPADLALAAGEAAEPTFATIGDFYRAIQAKIAELGDGIFTVGAERQVLSWFPPDRLFPIVDARSAEKALEIIMVEGEGTSKTPFEEPGEPAHYYTFGEIHAGRELVKTPTGFAYAGEAIPFDVEGVYPIRANAKLDDYPIGSNARVMAERYAYSYSSLLNALHESFNGSPETIDAAIGLMYELKLQAGKLMSTALDDGSGETVGPVYAPVDTQGGLPPFDG